MGYTEAEEPRPLGPIDSSVSMRAKLVSERAEGIQNGGYRLPLMGIFTYQTKA